MRLVRDSNVWEISHEGTMVRVDGTLRRYPSADQARDAFEAAVAAKRKEGFVDAPDVVSDLDARLVYADELQLRGDPIGELIAIQHALANLPESEDAQRKKAERRFAAVLETHHEALFGPLAPFVRRPSRATPARPALEITWRMGFADEMRIQRAAKIELHELFAELRKLPIARFMTKLVVGDSRLTFPSWQFAGRASYSKLLATMASDGAPAHLRTLVLGDFAGDRLLDACDLRPMLRTCAIEELVLKTGGLIGTLVSDSLQRLQVENLDLTVNDIMRSKLPRLEELVVLDVQVMIRLPLLIESALLANLRGLTLRRCRLEDRDLVQIVSFADAFEHLERLDLTGNDFGREAVKEARKRLPRLKA